MQITKLSPQQRNTNRINIDVDGTYRFSLDVYQVVDFGLRVGLVVTDEDIQRFEEESRFGKLYANALAYCVARPHSAREVKDYLYRKTRSVKTRNRRTGKVYDKLGVSVALTERVYSRLLEKGYIDDGRFARWWVENRHQSKGISQRKLRMELAAKGIASDIVESVWNDTDRNDSDELTKMIIRKRPRYPDEQKLIQYMMRQGFRYDDVLQAIQATKDAE